MQWARNIRFNRQNCQIFIIAIIRVNGSGIDDNSLLRIQTDVILTSIVRHG